jgi:hypothetical protein
VIGVETIEARLLQHSACSILALSFWSRRLKRSALPADGRLVAPLGVAGCEGEALRGDGLAASVATTVSIVIDRKVHVNTSRRVGRVRANNQNGPGNRFGSAMQCEPEGLPLGR